MLNLLYLLLPLLFSHLLIKWLLTIPTKNGKNNRTRTQPPSPRKLPILGNMHQLSSLAYHNLHDLARQHGPIMLLHFGSVPAVIISSAEAARLVMKTHDLIFSNRAQNTLTRRLLYDNKDVSMAQYGEYWRQLKSVCVLQLLSDRRVRSFQSIRDEETALILTKIEQSCSKPVDLSEMITELTNNVVCRASFGRKYDEGESGKRFRGMLSEFLTVLGTMSIGEYIPILSWVNQVNGFNKRVDKIGKQMDEFLESLFQERLEARKNEPAVGGGSENREDFLDILLGIYQGDNNTTGVLIDRDSIKAILVDVFAAGTDTTSTVVEWTMSELLRHPTIMKRLQEEIRGVLQGKPVVTYQDLPKLPYLKCVIKETLRVHPPIPLLVARQSTADVELMGYEVCAGTMVMVNAWTIGRDPKIWDEPEKFNPDRFLESGIDYRGHHFELIPFGGGRRICPGISFAMATDEFFLANLVNRFDWVLPGGVKPEDLDMTERPGVSIRRRVPLLAIPMPCTNILPDLDHQ